MFCQATDQLRRGEDQLLPHRAAEREAEHVDLAETQRLDEGDRIGGHPFDRGRHLAGTARDAGIVEQDDFAVLGEAVGHQRVPMVHGAGEMHVEDERHARGLTETAIGEADALGLDELRGCALMGVSRHIDESAIRSGSARAMNAASAPRRRSSASRTLPSVSRRPETTRRAPSLAKAMAVARPMPVRAPVIKTTGLFMVLLLKRWPAPDGLACPRLAR